MLFIKSFFLAFFGAALTLHSRFGSSIPADPFLILSNGVTWDVGLNSVMPKPNQEKNYKLVSNRCN